MCSCYSDQLCSRSSILCSVARGRATVPSGEARPNPSLLLRMQSPSPAGLAARRRPRRRTQRPPSPSPQRPSQPERWTLHRPRPSNSAESLPLVPTAALASVSGASRDGNQPRPLGIGIRWSARHTGGRRAQTRCSLFRQIRRLAQTFGGWEIAMPFTLVRPSAKENAR